MSLQDPESPFAALDEGAAVLVTGPAMSGKYALALRALGACDRAILVTTRTTATTAREDFAPHGDPDSLAVVDCASKAQDHTARDGEWLRYASSPQNLTEIGMKFTDLVETFLEEGEDVATGVAIDSLSQLLMYWEPERVYQFVRVFLQQTRGLGWTTVAVLDDAAHDDQTVRTLTEPFDAVANTRVEGDDPEFRLRGAGIETEWTPL